MQGAHVTLISQNQHQQKHTSELVILKLSIMIVSKSERMYNYKWDGLDGHWSPDGVKYGAPTRSYGAKTDQRTNSSLESQTIAG